MSINKDILINARIDCEGGIRRFAGKEALYEKYLGRFLEETKVAETEAALEADNFQQILELTHALKGEAGTLGMDCLFNLCQEVVSLIRTEDYTKEQVAEIVVKIREESDSITKAVREALN